MLDSCKNMTMYSLFMLGTMAAFQCFFDILGLLTALGGRETTSSTVQGDEDDVTVITRRASRHVHVATKAF